MASPQPESQKHEDPPSTKKQAASKKKGTGNAKGGVKKNLSRPLNSVGRYKVEKELEVFADRSKLIQVSLPDLPLKMVMRYVPIVPENKALIEQMKLDIRVFSSVNHPIVAKYLDSFVLDDDPLVFCLVVELHLGASLDRILNYMVLNDRYMEERDAWLILIQMLITIPEFRKFGVVLSMLHHCNLIWTDDLKLLYYPRSFIGAFSRELAQFVPQQIAPEFMDQELDGENTPAASKDKPEGSEDFAKSSLSKSAQRGDMESLKQDRSDLFVLGMIFFTFFKRDHRLFDYRTFQYDLSNLCNQYETGISVYGLTDRTIYTPMLNQVIRKMVEIDPADRMDIAEIFEIIKDRQEFNTLRKLHPKQFRAAVKDKVFVLNPPVDLEFKGPRATNKLLKETYGGIGLDGKKMAGAANKPATRTKAVGTKTAGAKTKAAKLKSGFAEDLVGAGLASGDDPQAQFVKSTMANKSSIDKIATKPAETRAERLERMKREKLDNDTRFRFTREKNVKQLTVPQGFKAVPWLPTETEDDSMTISEESSDQADDTLAELEANDLIDMARHGITYQELTGTKMTRPYNTHLIYVNKKDRDELEDEDSGSTPGEEPTEDSRNRQESIITELADFVHNQDHFEEVMKRPAGNTATIKKGAIAYDLYEEDKPKTIGRIRATQPTEGNAQMNDSNPGTASAQQLLDNIALAFGNVFYPEVLAEQEIGSLPSESKVKLKEEPTDLDIENDLDAYILDGQPIYRTIHRHQNIYSSDEELLDSVAGNQKPRNRFDFIRNFEILY